MQSKIEFVYFDLGNVIVHFDHRLACRQMADVSGTSVEAVREVVFQNGLEDEIETGNLTPEDFVAQFSHLTATHPDPDALLHAASNIFWLNRQILPLITQLKAVKFPIGILSNTCSPHWEFVLKKFPFVAEAFSIRTLSFESRSMKPDPSIYTDAIAKTGLRPQQIFFCDDRQENVDGAIAAGIDADLFQSTAMLNRALLRRGVKINF